MKPLTADQRHTLEVATKAFEDALPGSAGVDYLKGRGITGTTAQAFRLGYVPEGIEGWEKYEGMVSIPNLSAAGHPVGMKFRNLEPDAKMKYTGKSGEEKRLFHTRALTTISSVIAITEGEFDTIVCGQVGMPALSVASGAQSWRKRHSRMLAGYSRVLLVIDNDDPGKELARRLKDDLYTAHLVTMPEGCKDINDVLVQHGEDRVKEVLGL